MNLAPSELTLARFSDPAAYRARAEAFLMTHEAANNLQLGLTSALMHKPDLFGESLYFAVVEAGPEVVAAALMTPPHRLIVAHCLRPAALDLIVRDVYAFRPETPGVIGLADVSRQAAERWAALTGRAVSRGMAERIYQLTRARPPEGVSGRLRRATASDRGLLVEWVTAFQREAFDEPQPAGVERLVDNWLTLPPEIRGAFLWEDRQPVSLAGYGGPTPNGIRLGPVYTPPALRGRGYASACVAAASQLLLDAGRRVVFLFTGLANPTSNKIYLSIGYEPVADVDEYLFGPG